jgi:hypothetical protein
MPRETKTKHIFVEDVCETVKKHLGLDTPQDPEEEEKVFAPKFVNAVAWTPMAAANYSPQLALRPGSAMMVRIPSSSTMSKAVSGIRNLSILEVCSVLYMWWTSTKTGERMVTPVPGYHSYRVFFYGVPLEKITEIQDALATQNGAKRGGMISTILYPTAISVSPITGDNLGRGKKTVQGNFAKSMRDQEIKQSNIYEEMADDSV